MPGARSPQSTILVGAATRSIAHFPGTLPPLELTPRALALCEDAS